MPAVVNVGGVQFGESAHQVGVYNSQNTQSAWNSNFPEISVLVPLEGIHSFEVAGTAIFYNHMPGGQTLFDSDIKNNASPVWEGP